MKDLKKKKKKVADSTTCGFTNMQANIDAFNHNVSGAGSIPGTGASMGESITEDFNDGYKVDVDTYISELLNDGWKEAASANDFVWFTKSGEDYWITINKRLGIAFKQISEDDDEDSEERFELLKRKSVIDSDGFYTDYSMYYNKEDNTYVFVFGDSDLYRPEDGYFDYECESEEEANEWFDGYNGFEDDDDEFVEDDMMTEELGDVGDLPDLSEENIIAQEDAGISSLFIDAINECWNMIDSYHSIIVTLDSLDRHEFDDTLQGLLEERNKEVGALQGILEMLSPASAKIEQGKEEAQEESSFDQVEEDFGLNESIAKSDKKSKRISESKKSKTISKLLKEDWNSNGKLEDFDPADLMKKASDNKGSIYSVRDFGGKQLYINIDPGFLFGVRMENSKIWVDVVEIDGDKQNRIFLDSATSEEEAVEKLNKWKDDYIHREGENKDEETNQEDQEEI